jgi:hypothetical protein
VSLAVRWVTCRNGGEDLLQLRDGLIVVAVEQRVSRGGEISRARDTWKGEKRDPAEREKSAAKVQDAQEGLRCK